MAVPGRFNDGKTAASHPVTVHVRPGGIDIRSAHGDLLAVWPREVLHSDGLAPCGGIKLRSAAEPHARLIAEDQPELRAMAKTARPPARWKMAALAAASLMLAWGIYAALPVAARAIAHLVPPEFEREWARQMVTTLRVCRSPAGNAALRALNARLFRVLPADVAVDQVVVAHDPRVNAFALPGGTVVILSGLLAKADHPDQVAGVLAHELTHISERHASARMVRELGMGALVALVTGDASGLAAGGAAMVMSNAYGRSDEEDADEGAVALLHQAHISTEGMVKFFDMLAENRPADRKSMLEWLDTHPDPKARAAAIKPTPGPTTPALTPEQWADLKRICR